MITGMDNFREEANKLVLKEAREKAGMSMDELGKKAGVSSAAICRYEHGLRIPKVPIAKKLGKILGIKWYDLIDEKGA